MRWAELIKSPGIYISISLLVYATYGVYVNDLYIPSLRFSTDGIHFRGAAAIMMGCALGAGSLFLFVKNLEADEIAQSHWFGELLKYLAVLLAIVAFAWGEIMQHNKAEEKDYGGQEIARYIMDGVGDLRLKSLYYSPDGASFRYWITVKSDKYQSSDEVKKLSENIAERLCSVESVLQVKLITSNIHIIVTQGNYWLLNRTINISECDGDSRMKNTNK